MIRRSIVALLLLASLALTVGCPGKPADNASRNELRLHFVRDLRSLLTERLPAK